MIGAAAFGSSNVKQAPNVPISISPVRLREACNQPGLLLANRPRIPGSDRDSQRKRAKNFGQKKREDLRRERTFAKCLNEYLARYLSRYLSVTLAKVPQDLYWLPERYPKSLGGQM